MWKAWKLSFEINDDDDSTKLPTRLKWLSSPCSHAVDLHESDLKSLVQSFLSLSEHDNFIHSFISSTRIHSIFHHGDNLSNMSWVCPGISVPWDVPHLYHVFRIVASNIKAVQKSSRNRESRETGKHCSELTPRENGKTSLEIWSLWLVVLVVGRGAVSGCC